MRLATMTEVIKPCRPCCAACIGVQFKLLLAITASLFTCALFALCCFVPPLTMRFEWKCTRRHIGVVKSNSVANLSVWKWNKMKWNERFDVATEKNGNFIYFSQKRRRLKPVNVCLAQPNYSLFPQAIQMHKFVSTIWMDWIRLLVENRGVRLSCKCKCVLLQFRKKMKTRCVSAVLFFQELGQTTQPMLKWANASAVCIQMPTKEDTLITWNYAYMLTIRSSAGQ